MWGTVFTLDDGWGHLPAIRGVVGWHVCKVRSPIAQGPRGSLDADVARGLLRMDHGSQYLSDHFLKQIRYWGIHPSFGFVEEPETNGVAERWNRTSRSKHPRPNLSEPRGRPRRRGRLRGAVQPDLALLGHTPIERSYARRHSTSRECGRNERSY